MIIPDVHLLVHSHNRASRDHAAARSWWVAALKGDETVGLAWATILGFVRLTTSRHVLARPLSVNAAIEIVEDWLAEPSVRLLVPGRDHAALVFGYLRKAGVGANLTTDAHLAALAVEYQAEIHSTDADFARFSGLRWRNPIA